MHNLCKVCKHELLPPNKELFSFSTITSDCRPWKSGRSVALCPKCGILQRVGEMGNVYDGYELSEHIAHAYRTSFILRNIPLAEPESILDVGAGNGAGLYVLQEKFPNATLVNGYDPHGTFSGCLKKKPDSKYDLITMFQVLEHVENPAEELGWIAQHLNKDGVLLIDVPNCIKWPFDFIIADHIWHFTKISLTRLLHKLGFLVVFISDDIVKNTITCLAKFKGKCVEADFSIIKDKCLDSIDWLIGYKNFLNNIDKPVAIFGSSPPSAWVAHILGLKAACFLDDNPDLHGKRLNATIILETKRYDLSYCVVLPFYGEQLQIIKQKHLELNFI